MTLDAQSRFLQVHCHTTVHYRVAGGGPRPVVLVHGFGASSHSWDNLIQRLPRDRVTCYAVDLKGFGKSSKHPADHYGIDAQAQAVEAVMRHEGLADVVMVGNSMGGGVALYEAVRDARRDDRLLAGIVLLGPACYPQALPFFMRLLTVPVVGPLMMMLFNPVHAARINLRKLIHDETKITQEMIDRFVGYYSEPGCRRSIIRVARQLVPEDFERVIASYKTIRCPAVIVWGRHDHLVPPAFGPRLAEDIPDSTLVMLECGHLPQEECPEETTREIISLLDRLDRHSAET